MEPTMLEQAKVLKAVGERGAATRGQLAKDTSLPPETIKACLGLLFSTGRVEYKTAAWSHAVWWIRSADAKESINALMARSRREHPDLWPKREVNRSAFSEGSKRHNKTIRDGNRQLILTLFQGDGEILTAEDVEAALDFKMTLRTVQRILTTLNRSGAIRKVSDPNKTLRSRGRPRTFWAASETLKTGEVSEVDDVSADEDDWQGVVTIGGDDDVPDLVV